MYNYWMSAIAIYNLTYLIMPPKKERKKGKKNQEEHKYSDV